jgi:hypothetical protein
MASAMVWPISASWAEMAATEAISSWFSTSRAWLRMASATASVGPLHAPLEAHRVGPGGHVAQALVDQGLGEHGGGGGAVTGHVVGLGRDLLGQLGTEVLVVVLELDLLGDGHAVVGDGGGAPLLVEDDVAALGAEGDADHVGQLVDPGLEGAARLDVEQQLLWHGFALPRYLLTIARTSRAEQDQQLVPASLTSVPPYLE